MEKKAVFALVSLWFVFSFGKIKPTEREKVNWLSIEEVHKKMAVEPRPVLIDLYTNWCYWCKVMDEKTYSNPKVIKYINEHFYTIRFNAETTDSITWNGAGYRYNARDKVNDFSLYVTQGQLAFPNTVIFPNLAGIPASIPGFMKPKEIEVILTYFGEGAYKTGNFKAYADHFKSTW